MRFSALDSAPVRCGAAAAVPLNESQADMLSLLHPGRIDLGLGRSGGSQLATDTRIRRTIVGYDSFTRF